MFWFFSIFTGLFAFLQPKEANSSINFLNDDVVKGYSEEEDILARTIWGEARGEGVHGMKAVAHVILNRLAITHAKGAFWWGSNIIDICKKPWQFSCWNKTDANFLLIQNVTTKNEIFKLALEIAKMAINGSLGYDFTNGATHYHTKSIKPNWADNARQVANLGSHIFYKEV